MGTSKINRTHYDILGVPADATAQQIKAAYRTLSKRLHPDVAPGTENLFRLIAEAYEVLGDPAARARYDRALPVTSSTSPSTDPAAAQSTGTRYTRPTASAGPRASKAGQGSPFSSWDTFMSDLRTDRANARRSRPTSTAETGWTWARYRALPAGARIAWWTPLVTVTLALAASAVRLTGATASWFGAVPGTHLLTGTWTHTPSVSVSTLSDAWRIAALAGVLTVGYAARKTLAPTSVLEKAVLLTALVSLTGAGEYLLATGAGKLAAFAAILTYCAWLRLLARQPRPASDAQWASFTRWMIASPTADRLRRAARSGARRASSRAR